jgi:hypothetical protein
VPEPFWYQHFSGARAFLVSVLFWCQSVCGVLSSPELFLLAGEFLRLYVEEIIPRLRYSVGQLPISFPDPLYFYPRFFGPYVSPSPWILWPLDFSSACHSPAPPILQRLPFSSDCHSPVPTILQCPPSNDFTRVEKRMLLFE